MGVRIHHIDNPTAPHWLPPKAQAAVRLIRKVIAVARLIKEWDIDLVDARLDSGMIYGVVAALFCRKPSVATLYQVSPGRKFPLWRLVRLSTINMTSAVITDSGVRQKEFRRWIWNPSGSAWHIPNGIAAPVATKSPEDVRVELGVPDDAGTRVIVQIAGLVPYKGQMVLLNAARIVLEREPRAFFLIIGYCRGQEDFKAQLLERCDQLGIAARVRICAYPGSIGDVWQLVDVHVHASLFDSLPNVVLEGMALAKPAVVTSVGGMAEAVENDQTGLVVPPNDPESLAEALLRCLQWPDEAKSFGLAAKARYDALYRPERMAAALGKCFDSVMSAASESRS
jgi:glycosyltransferase involved in cell wall biosynthesis